MKLKIISPEGLVYEGNSIGFVINTKMGQQTVLDQHINMLSFFDFSEITLVDDFSSHPLYVALGYLHVIDDVAQIIALAASKNKKSVEEVYKNISNYREERGV